MTRGRASASGGEHATPVPKSTATSEPAITLLAKYDWSDGARDVSGFRARHDGVLDPGASVKNGKLVRHFDSIEYRFRGAAPPEERLAIRWNGGKWVTGGWKNKEHFRTRHVPVHASPANERPRRTRAARQSRLGERSRPSR